MPKLTVFYLSHCPYCRMAREAVRELQSGDPGFQTVVIDWIEESEHPEIAERYDYYRVPSVYLGDLKLYECSPQDGRSEILSRMEDALRKASARP